MGYLENKNIIDHIEDLRGVIIKTSIYVVFGIIIAFIFAPNIFNVLLKPYSELLLKTNYLSINNYAAVRALKPSEAFVVSVNIAVIAGIVIAIPVFIYNLYKFLNPGLNDAEKKTLSLALIISPILFIFGSLFAYYVVFPIVINFLWNYTLRMGVYPQWTVSYYMGFILLFLFVFGIAFQLPIILLLLAKLNLVKRESLIRNRKYAIVIMFIVSAFLTPPDIISQILLGIPLICLYELSILMMRFFIKDV